MTRNLMTELVIRLLAIWFIIRSISSLLEGIFTLKETGLSFWLFICMVIILISLSILAIIFSKRIAKLIWADRKTDEEIVLYSKEKETFLPLMAIVGMYFIITSLAIIVNNIFGILLALSTTSSTARNGIFLYQINRLLNPIFLLLFGIITFCFPEKIMSMRFNIRKIFKKEGIHWENIEEE